MDEIIHFSSSERQMQNRFRDAQQTGDQEEMEMIMLEYETMLDNTQLFARNIISQNPESPVAAYIYLMNFFQEAEIEELDSIVTLFAPIKESEFVKTIEDRAEKLRVSVVGAQAPDFTLNNADGEQISLSSLQGKYVLIDFWASWCQPCMVELPNLIDLYDQYNDKGFEIFGVSLDRDRNAWVNTVDEKNMVWPNVWDMEGEEPAEAATLYGVTGIPHTVLLDKEGVIIAKNLRGEELKNKLEEILN
jgi:peroxiredoxin